MSQVKRSDAERVADLANMIKALTVFEQPRIVIAALAAATAKCVFAHCPDYQHFEAADHINHGAKKALIQMRSKVRS